MARRVFFHIGVPKSGTTFLQTTMWHNRPRLRAQGFLYPGSNRMEHYHASEVVRRVSRNRGGEAANAWDNLVGALARWSGDGLISHEFFGMATGPQAARAIEELAPAEVHVVLTVRDYVRQFPAVWQEALKMRSGSSLDEFMQDAFADRLKGAWGWRSQDVPAILERWSATVPIDRVHVITVPPSGAPRHLLWDRWCEVLGLDDSSFSTDVAFGNESLGVAQAALLHRVKPHLAGELTHTPVTHRWVRGYFGHEVLVPQAGDRFGLRAEQAAELRRRSVEMVDAIRSGGYAVTGDLADLVPADPLPVLPHPDDVSDAEIVDVAARALARMIDDVRVLTDERDRWRRRARRVPVSPESRLGQLARRVRDRLRR